MEIQKKSEILDLAYSLADQDSRLGYLHYLRHVVIDSRPEPRRFSTVAFPWQWAWAREASPALESVCGFRDYSGPRCFWRTLARGHDKTTGLARKINWALGYGKRKIAIDAAAADWDQAALLLAAMRREAELNPWLATRIEFQKKGARGQGGELTILTSDAPSAAGRLPDLVIVDEPTHWESRDLWDMIFSGLSKRPDAVAFVITNAGVKGTWQEEVKEACRQIPWRWSVYEAPGRLETWMSPEQVEADRKLLLPSEARRLLDNEWIDPAEESGFLHRADIERCLALGRDLTLSYQTHGKPGVEYWAGIDYGPKRDRTALAILHQTDAGLVVLDKLDVWQGSPQAPIQIAEIRSWIHEARQAFPNLHIVVDPHQLEELVQDLERHIPIERYEARGGKANYHLAETLRSLVVNQSIAWYPGAGALPVNGRMEDLTDELLGLVTRPMSYGYRIDHEATKHDDRAVAVGMACTKILTRPRSTRFQPPPIVDTPTPLRPELRIRTSAESRGIYGMRTR